MRQFLIRILCLIFFGLTLSCYAAPNTGGGGGQDLKGVCELAGGQWTGVESGNWACCWPDWGCYGCYNGQCKMQCRTQRCRRANNMRTKPSQDQQSVEGLVKPGMVAPIAPKPKNSTETTPETTPDSASDPMQLD